ncbi:MAG: pilus assembly protein [bacterium]|nr:pilus assembly protein [bacterium]MCY4271762.1 pilus assembly protein [bacterium]
MNDQTQPYRLVGETAERGSSMVELTLFTPIMVALLFFVIAAGRVGTIQSKLTAAASGAARAAAQHQSIPTAQAAATMTAEASLRHSDLGCANGPKVYFQELNLSPGGKVMLRISCAVRLSDLALPGLPGNLEVSAASVSVVDRYRSESASP